MHQKEKVLFVCSHIPSHTAHQAGHKIAYTNLINLSKNNIVDLVVLCKTNDYSDFNNIESLRYIVNSISIVNFSMIDRFFGIFLGLCLGFAPRFSTRINLLVVFKLINLKRKNSYDMVWLEFSQSFWVSKLITGSESIVMSAHDLQTQVVSRKNFIESLLFLGWTFLTEAALLRKSSTIRVLSQKDADFIKSFFLDCSHIEVSRPVLSNFIYSIKRVKENIEPYSLLFWGAMNRVENSQAIIRFVNIYFSELIVSFPSIKLYIVGSSPPRKIYELAEKWKHSIIVTGFVENPSQYFEKCSLGIVPLLSGAGIKVKVLEMLEAKIPVLSTPLGAEGIDDHSLLYISSIHNFTQKLKQLWN